MELLHKGEIVTPETVESLRAALCSSDITDYEYALALIKEDSINLIDFVDKLDYLQFGQSDNVLLNQRLDNLKYNTNFKWHELE